MGEPTDFEKGVKEGVASATHHLGTELINSGNSSMSYSLVAVATGISLLSAGYGLKSKLVEGAGATEIALGAYFAGSGAAKKGKGKDYLANAVGQMKVSGVIPPNEVSSEYTLSSGDSLSLKGSTPTIKVNPRNGGRGRG
jgi:hypothetical protein